MYLPWELYNDPTAVYRLEFRAPMLRSLLHVSDALCFMRALTSALSPGQGLSSRNSKRSELRYKYPSIGSVYDFFLRMFARVFGIICLNATVHLYLLFSKIAKFDIFICLKLFSRFHLLLNIFMFINCIYTCIARPDGQVLDICTSVYYIGAYMNLDSIIHMT